MTGQMRTEWSPGRGQTVALTIAGLLVTALGCLAHLALWASRQEATTFLIEGPALMWGFAATLAAVTVALIVHELVHGLAMLPFGARPVFGAGWLSGMLPYLYCTAEKHRFTRGQFVWIALAPTLLVGGTLAAATVWAPYGAAMALAGGLHLGGCVGDWAMTAVALRQRRGVLIEDTGAAMRFHEQPEPDRRT